VSDHRWKEEIIELGEMGREDSARVTKFEDLDLNKGLFRLEGTEKSKKSKAYIISKMEDAGLEVRYDKVGNIYARKEGSKPGTGAVMSGSHLDSVLNGGMFDGVLGVVGALEAVRRMNDENFDNERPIEIVVFMGEEGSAFKKGLLGSDVAVGKRPVEEALLLTNEANITLDEALKGLGQLGDFEMDFSAIEYFIEMHVEQGPVLDREKVPIGIVENITGITWVTANINGQENHAGTTPMSMRIDPLVAASNIVLLASRRANEMVKKSGGSTVATVGKMVVKPGAPNIIPGSVEMGIDIRDGIEKNMKRLQTEIIHAIKELAEQYKVTVTLDIPIYHPPCPCSGTVVEAIEQAAADMGIRAMRMNSGAGHDAQNVAQKVKTGMIFVPSVDGVSHSPLEWTDWEDIENGVAVLTSALKQLSRI
jgi:hydantoinase/carbamoylase family amidase